MTTTPQGTALLTIPEVAAELRVTRSTVYRYIESGLLAPTPMPHAVAGKDGRRRTRTRISRADLDAFIRAGRAA